MDARAEAARQLQRSEAISAEFVRIELELAITFCEMALATEDPDKRRRNLQNAHRAYEVACRFANRIQMNQGESFRSGPDVSSLRALLARVRQMLRI